MVAPIPVQLGYSAHVREYAKSLEIRMENRFFETDPANGEGAAIVSRPGVVPVELDAELAFSDFYGLFTKPGVFDADLFIVTESAVFRMQPDGTVLEVDDSSAVSGAVPSFAAMVGPGYANLFVNTGSGFGYVNTRAAARVYVRGDGSNERLYDQTVRVGSIYYKWRGAGSVNAGAPDGTSGNPYLINHNYSGGSGPWGDFEAIRALHHAINGTGVPGADYSSTLTSANPDVMAGPLEDGRPSYWQITLSARTPGAGGNALEIEVVGSSGPEVGNGTSSSSGPIVLNFAGGGVLKFYSVARPDGLPFSKIVSLGAYVLLLQEGSQRFYFIRPGSTSIGGLDYEAAESEPDELVDAVEVGDLVWLFGRSSLEAWYATGDSERPLRRQPGLSHRIGAVPGTPTVVNSVVYFVGSDDSVYSLAGGVPRRVSGHAVEEQIRLAASGAMRGWGFSLDGHHFYVLQLEKKGTWVYDALTGQWHRWYTGADKPHWRLTAAVTWGRRVIGIDSDGDALLEITPDAFLDGDAHIPHVVTGFVPHRTRDYRSNTFLRILGSIGYPDEELEDPVLELRISDDAGATWKGPYTVELTDDPQQDVTFRSLGRIGSPGRAFELSDTGGLVRIDAAYTQID